MMMMMMMMMIRRRRRRKKKMQMWREKRMKQKWLIKQYKRRAMIANGTLTTKMSKSQKSRAPTRGMHMRAGTYREEGLILNLEAARKWGGKRMEFWLCFQSRLLPRRFWLYNSAAYEQMCGLDARCQGLVTWLLNHQTPGRKLLLSRFNY
jgi:hypothetical protein